MMLEIIIGIFAGTITGLFGAGGGMILVPAFTYLLKFEEKEARATSILCILPMVLVSGFFYLKGTFIDFKMSILCAIRRNCPEDLLDQSFYKNFQIKN